MKALHINGNDLTLEAVREVAVEHRAVLLDPDAREGVQTARTVVDALVASNQTSYAITTGVGKLSDVLIPPDQIRELQVNLVRSHAVGVGDPLRDVASTITVPRARPEMTRFRIGKFSGIGGVPGANSDKTNPFSAMSRKSLVCARG